MAALIELGYAHVMASSATQPLVEAMGRGSYTLVPVLEELAKLAPLLLAGLNIKIRYQLGLSDYVILGAATGAGLGLYEVLLSHLLDAQRAAPYPYGGWMLSGGLSLSSTYIPDLHTVLTTWLPASLGSLDLSFTQPSLDTNLHLAWGAIGALGAGLLLRGRGWRRLFGLLPIAYAMGHHTLVNYTGSRDAHPPGWTTSLLGTANGLVTYAPLICLAIAMVLDFAQLQRGKQAMPAVLLNAERTGNAAIGPLTTFGAQCLPWTALIALRFARMRRSLLYAAGRTDPARLELLHTAVADTAARIDAVNQDRAWDSERIRAYLREVRPSRPWRRRWPLLVIPLVLMTPSLLFLALGSFTSTKGLQHHFTTGAGPTLLMWFGIAALIWALIQLALLLRAWRTTSRPPLAEPQAVVRRVFTAVGSTLTTGLLLAARYRGTPLNGDVTDSLAMLLAALENLELYAGIALTILALAALIMLFPPGGLVLAGGGILAGAASVEAAQAAALGTAGVLLMAQGAHGADGGGEGGQSSGSSASADGSASSGPGKGPWQATDDIKGPAAGKQLRFPNSRHTVSGSKSGEVKESNSVILRGQEREVAQDVSDIAQGKAKHIKDTDRYEVNGRTYGVERSGTVYPDSGPGIAKLDRNEYAALQQVTKAKGDISAAPQLTRNPRFTNNPEAVQKALKIYNGIYP
ncbi:MULTISPECIES: hypothetical protein [unclassified Streptomyces]|uniref:hypothetical protein n=1 Tax=unclassified Streptomyces TaxID=2593676 RepID=UPI002E22C746|nr:hypothetical protein OG217_19620 [Streptomyces sp. NBC_01023]